MTAIESMKAELSKIQEAQEACLTDWGHVKTGMRYRYQTLVKQAEALKTSIEWMTALYAGRP